MISNEFKKEKNGCYFLAHADTRFTSAESEQLETRTYNYRSVPSVSESSTVVYRLINNGIFVHCPYRQKRGSCSKNVK